LTVETLTISTTDFDELAGGRGGAAALALLRAGQVNRRRLLLRSLLDRARSEAPAAFDAAAFDDSYDLLADVENVDAGAVTAVLLAPGVGLWLAGSLAQLAGGAARSDDGDGRRQQEEDDGLATELSYLANVAAAAAVRAGHPCTVRVRARDGAVLLPTLGCARVAPTGSRWSWRPATVEVGPAGASVHGASETVTIPAYHRADGPGWQGLRQLTASAGGRRLAVDLDDLGTSLGAGEAHCERLTVDEVARWRRRFAAAMALLAADHGDQLEAIAACLGAIVPLRCGARHGSMTVTSRLAFGAVGTALPGTAEELAETLVHELAHAKLYALHDLVPLCSEGPGALHRSPWRRDPRPVAGLLHGAYAFLAVCDLHRRRSLNAHGHRRTLAGFEVALRRREVAAAIETLLDGSALTVHGVAFVERMQATLAAWPRRDDPRTEALADQAAEYQRLRWRLHNVVPDPGGIRRLADAWASGGANPVPVDEIGDTVAGADRGGGWNALAHLMRLRLEHPERFATVTRDPTLLAREASGASAATPGDVALVRGDHPAARTLYRLQLGDDPHGPEHWAGLAVALAALGDGRAARVLARRPEVVAAVSTQVAAAGAPPPDPERLAEWIDAPHSGRRARSAGTT
jgi:HEXXH motif-containing protein